MNAIVERIIHMIHHVLEVLLSKERVCRPMGEEFYGFLKEAAILNNSPLVSTHNDVIDLIMISPMSFLTASLPSAHVPNKFVGFAGARTDFWHVQS